MANMFEDFRSQTPTAAAPAKAPNMFEDFRPAPTYERPRTNWSMPMQALDIVTLGGMSKGNAAINALFDAGANAYNGGEFNYADAYDKNLADIRGAKSDYGTDHPYRAGAGDVAGVTLSAAATPALRGGGLLASMGTGGIYGAADGALRDADTVYERLANTATGAAAGTALGGAAHGVVSTVGAGVDALGRLKRNWNLTPELRAEVKLADMADQRYPNAAHVVPHDLNKLGPEAVRVDVLGEPGYAATRRAANISPEARETVGNFADRRALGQNDRLTYDIQDIAGVTPGSDLSVGDMKKAAYDAVSPQIRDAYNVARKAGEDVPLDIFDNIITTPIGAPVFRQALDNMTSRAARDPSAAGNLAAIDETARLLQGKADQAFRAGDPMATEYASAAKALKERMDTFLAPDGGPYAAARDLRREAYRADEAFTAGENLGRKSPTFDHINAGRKVAAHQGPNGTSHAPNMAAAYAQTKAQSLATSRPGNGTLGPFTTTGGQNAAKTALGDAGADTLAEAVSREQTFNRLPGALGNSTTVRQAEDIANPALEAAAAGVNLLTGGVTGAVTGLARAAAGRLGRHFSTQAQRNAAPSLVDAILGRGALEGEHLIPSWLERAYAAANPSVTRQTVIGGTLGSLEAARARNGDTGIAGSFR